MNVANILPGDDVKVELRYTELLVPQAGNYQFVFPDRGGAALQQPAVGARRNAKWVAQPMLRAGVAPNTQLQASRSRSTRRWASRKCARHPRAST